ncbi:uncharacterized protein LOC117344963 [Pecten maximus]|uniref:uncharacterized protein LOC117344963 n=1 Tax=Pecten maximus TaxID=6579 RepID=UPI0014591AA5|nr:uncharacterized protein LOC117344963 [Pecten maximus]
MATRIRSDQNILGLSIKNNQQRPFKISQLADDTTLFLKSKQDIKKALNIIETFGSLSRLILNREKTKGLRLGNQRKIEDEFEDITWTDEIIKALGVHFCLNHKKMLEMNWNEKIEKMKKIINNWKRRKLTMIGRVQIVKSLLLPQLTFLMSMLHIDQNTIKQVEKIIYNYIWEGKTEKVKRNTMIKPYIEGGLNSIDIRSHIDTVRINWLKKLETEDKALWKVIPQFEINKFGSKYLICKMNLDNLKNLPISENISPFYYEILSTWMKLKKSNEPKKYNEILAQIIWGNKYIKLKGKTLLFKNWIDSGIITIKDLLQNNNNLDENNIYRKLIRKCNWLSEISMFKKAIPKIWLRKIEESDVDLQNFTARIKNQLMLKFPKQEPIKIEKCTNQKIYKHIVSMKSEKPIAHLYWENKLNLSDISITVKCSNEFIFKHLQNNKLKEFKWKFLNKIIPTREILHKWKISKSPNCNYCKVKEDYEHYFIKCEYLQVLSNRLKQIFETLGYKKDMLTLKNLVIGYKIEYPKYNEINHLLTVIGYSIYKSYYISISYWRNIPHNILQVIAINKAKIISIIMYILYNQIYTLIYFFKRKHT